MFTKYAPDHTMNGEGLVRMGGCLLDFDVILISTRFCLISIVGIQQPIARVMIGYKSTWNKEFYSVLKLGLDWWCGRAISGIGYERYTPLWNRQSIDSISSRYLPVLILWRSENFFFFFLLNPSILDSTKVRKDKENHQNFLSRQFLDMEELSWRLCRCGGWRYLETYRFRYPCEKANEIKTLTISFV